MLGRLLKTNTPSNSFIDWLESFTSTQSKDNRLKSGIWVEVFVGLINWVGDSSTLCEGFDEVNSGFCVGRVT